ncbi:MAG: Mrp/NBP35 family ATP-binding protein [Acidobacteriota bacterium]
MSAKVEASIRQALSKVLDPELKIDLVTAGMVKTVSVGSGSSEVEIELTTPACPLKDQIESEVRQALSTVDGLGELDLRFSARVRSAAPLAQDVPGIRNAVVVASGKGGVGKSTVAVNLAVALAAEGAKVGLLDADITGPSVAKMLDLEAATPRSKGGKLLPLKWSSGKLSLSVMSMAFFVEDAQAVMWRGPMLHKALQQFLQDVDWGEIDYLLIDSPPGTGDVQISLSQILPISGAVVVTTPQDVALLDVRRAVSLLEKVKIPVMGVVENMASFVCKDCGSEHHPFGQGGGQRQADDLDVPLLASVPLELGVRIGGDDGNPVVAGGSGPAADALAAAARSLAGRLSLMAQKNPFARELPVVK